jgi:glycosyltransferase involved in cell wall biosynthesis
VEEGQVGLQFEARDARDLADKISYLVEHPEENAHLQSNARPYVERNYSWNAVSQQVATAYQELLEEQSKERQAR